MAENEVLKKLRVKAGQRAIVLNAPESYLNILKEMPEGVQMAPKLEGPLDLIHYFATQRAELEREGPALKAALKPEGLLWISYPKGSAIPTDLKRDVVWAALGPFGLRPVAQVAIDEVWSALRFKIAG